MAVTIGSARIDENGNIAGGAAGDQTEKEVCQEDWYLHDNGWVVLRAKSDDVREWLAADMSAACDNDYIGYDQNQRNTLYNIAKHVNFDCSRVNERCECDCSALVRVCLAYAGIDVPDFYTGNEVSVIMATGEFDKLTAKKYTESDKYLMRGDILVTASKGHTAIVITNGSKVQQTETAPATDNPGFTNDGVRPGKKVLFTGKVAPSGLNVRTWAGANYPTFRVLTQGTEIGVCDRRYADNGDPWYYIRMPDGRYGFVNARYIN